MSASLFTTPVHGHETKTPHGPTRMDTPVELGSWDLYFEPQQATAPEQLLSNLFIQVLDDVSCVQTILNSIKFREEPVRLTGRTYQIDPMPSPPPVGQYALQCVVKHKSIRAVGKTSFANVLNEMAAERTNGELSPNAFAVNVRYCAEHVNMTDTELSRRIEF